MLFPSVSVWSRVTTISPLMGTPLTTLPSSIPSCIIPPMKPPPNVTFMSCGGGGGGAGVSLCAAAKALSPTNAKPSSIQLSALRRITDFIMLMVLSSISMYHFSSQSGPPVPPRRSPQRHRQSASEHPVRHPRLRFQDSEVPFARPGHRWSNSADRRTSAQHSLRLRPGWSATAPSYLDLTCLPIERPVLGTD